MRGYEEKKWSEDWLIFFWEGVSKGLSKGLSKDMNILSLVIFILILMFFLIWQNIQSLELEEKILALEKEGVQLYQDYHEELILYEKLRVGIEGYARKELGMVLPGRGDYRFMRIKNKEKLLRVLGLERDDIQ